MPRDILSEYGPDSPNVQKARATSGGPKQAKEMFHYSPPQGPIGQDHVGPGLGGDNHGCGCDGTREHMTGSPGLGGTRRKGGSQR